MKQSLFIGLLFILLQPIDILAQNGDKIGYCNVDYILAYLPDTKAAQRSVAAYEENFKSTLEKKMKAFQVKYVEYEKLAKDSNTSATILQSKERELQNMDNDIKLFQENADAELQKRQVVLMEPVFEKINKAIKDVAIENGYTYILNANEGGLSIVLYAPEQRNISNLILKKLGVNPPPTNN